MGKVLLGKREEDEVIVSRPKGDVCLTIVEVTVDP
jgi:transcription elongation GreA/GreB family factor